MGEVLTLNNMAAILIPLLPHVAVGIEAPHKAARGHFLQWFFVPIKNSILFCYGGLY